MLNKIMMTGRITTDLNVVTEEDYSYCLAFDENATSVSFLYSKGGQITFVGSLRKATDNTVVIIVEELHFQNKFAVKVDVDSVQLF